MNGNRWYRQKRKYIFLSAGETCNDGNCFSQSANRWLKRWRANEYQSSEVSKELFTSFTEGGGAIGNVVRACGSFRRTRIVAHELAKGKPRRLRMERLMKYL